MSWLRFVTVPEIPKRIPLSFRRLIAARMRSYVPLLVPEALHAYRRRGIPEFQQTVGDPIVDQRSVRVDLKEGVIVFVQEIQKILPHKRLAS